MEKEKLKLEQEVAQNLAYGDFDDTIYEVINNKIVGKSRWSDRSELIIKTIKDGRFWRAFYSQGSTESQDESPFEYSEPIFEEVFPKKIEITIYE